MNETQTFCFFVGMFMFIFVSCGVSGDITRAIDRNTVAIESLKQECQNGIH